MKIKLYMAIKVFFIESPIHGEEPATNCWMAPSNDIPAIQGDFHLNASSPALTVLYIHKN